MPVIGWENSRNAEDFKMVLRYSCRTCEDNASTLKVYIQYITICIYFSGVC